MFRVRMNRKWALEVRVRSEPIGLGEKRRWSGLQPRAWKANLALRLIKIRSSKTLRGVKRFRALVVLPRLNVLGRSLTDLCFCLVKLILQVLLTNLRKNRSATT